MPAISISALEIQTRQDAITESHIKTLEMTQRLRKLRSKYIKIDLLGAGSWFGGNMFAIAVVVHTRPSEDWVSQHPAWSMEGLMRSK